ncbi:FAD-dependent oxidoreductase [Cyanobacterium sp. IPPAS B-1200]|uniref:FAD-dependent oxidoreductase n=1 Tax=Cyanobacterium sp. IPPAS B-1200 TaxID=1562720 RepID=UPI00085260CD|nr:FAD-dependent oxidoreductase [Cyanobacterium sp. IPPAS B-1200]OEJ79933.1 FAD-binding protein [Cyanobacterium sp. IPPAS B-1200]
MKRKPWQKILSIPLVLFVTSPAIAMNNFPRNPEQIEECDILVIGGGLAGAGAAYEALLMGKTVCLTEITDWVGGQISSQGTSALDERNTQRQELFFPKGYLEFRDRIADFYGKLNLGECWVSASCFLPKDADYILERQLQDAARKGNGTLKWFPNTVIKDVQIERVENGGTGEQIVSAIAISHQPQPNTPPLNSEPLSQIIEDAYTYEDSSRLKKTVIKFVPPQNDNLEAKARWMVIEATETGEIIGLTDIPYRLGIDPLSAYEPSSSSRTPDPYCTQGFTYTFAMEKTETPQPQPEPEFYQQYAPYYSYELERLADFDLVFTYRRIYKAQPSERVTFGGIGFTTPTPGDIAMQNWTWGNDYRPGTSVDNLIYSREQLQASGQLQPHGWMGGLRTETLFKGEQNAIGFYHWLVAGTTDSQLGDGVKKPHPDHIFLTGFDSPMGTTHGLSKYPYIREGRRIIGRPNYAHPDGFTVNEVDISRVNYDDDYYKETLTPQEYRQLRAILAGLEGFGVISGEISPDQAPKRSRSTVYADSVGIGHYAIDFHPCMTESPHEKPGNTEREGERRGQGQAYPFQIPLSAMIPQKIDNMIVAGKSIATSHIAAAAYRVHSFEWSSGAAAGTTAAMALDKNILPYEFTEGFAFRNPHLQTLKTILDSNGNPTAFPNTSIFNEDWDRWR